MQLLKRKTSGVLEGGTEPFRMAIIGQKKKNDWKFLVIVFFLLNVISLGIHYYIFDGINHEELFVSNKKERVNFEGIDKGAVKKIVEYYRDKESRYQNIGANKFTLVDPSL